MAVGSLMLLAPAAYAEPIRPGEEATFDLGILPPSTPDVLKAAATAPYIAPAGSDCESISREIAALDEVLGPDADAPQPGGVDTGRLVGQAVKSLIPYRSVARFVTGAARKQRERDRAAMAGWARRGYLKAIQANQSCPGATATAVVADAQPPPDLVPARLGGTEAGAIAPHPAPLISPPPYVEISPPEVRLGRVNQAQPSKIETTFAR